MINDVRCWAKEIRSGKTYNHDVVTADRADDVSDLFGSSLKRFYVQRTVGPFGDGNPGRPPRLSHTS